jgi:Zn-finger nucleic acid-binding protein
MDAATLNCPMCGAPSRDAATQCAHCGSRLAKTACPSCFGLIFAGSKHCQHCGAKIARENQPTGKPRVCPRCKVDLESLTIGPTNLHECPRCDGLWIDVETFDAICADRERQAAVLGGTPAPAANPPDFTLSEVRYVGCCVCGKLMNRVNFSGRSGVIVDVCKAHGTWFDREELRRIVEFIHAGGLEKSRARDREQWAEERRRLEAARRKPKEGVLTSMSSGPRTGPWDVVDLGDVVVLAARSLWNLFDSHS